MRPALRVSLVAIAAIVVAHLGDHWARTRLVQPDIYDHDLGRMLRTAGFLPIWLLLALALWLQTGDRRRALLLAVTPTIGGLMAEVLKIVLRRERPGLHDGAYVFRAFSDRTFATADIGLPSSHALVAFSAGWLLCRMYPRAWPVWLGLAAGCGLTRILAQAHFLSDVTVAVVAAYLIVAVIWAKWGTPSERTS